jgi:hypothetical protein
MRKLALLLLFIGTILISCSKIQNDEGIKKKFPTDAMLRSKEIIMKRYASYHQATRLNKQDPEIFLDLNGDTVYCYPIGDSLMGDSLRWKEYTEDMFFYPVKDCYGNWIVSREEKWQTTNPDYLWVYNLTDSIPYCYFPYVGP